MSDSEDDLFIVPPPGIAPLPQPRTEPEPAAVDADDLISLPPGIVDSGTYRMPSTREPRPSSLDDAPAFFPVGAPGLPIQPPVAAEVDDATRVSVGRRSALAWRLTLAQGEEVLVERSTLIGRDPAATAEWPDAILLPVIDPGKTVSKTHAAVELTAGGALLVHDLDSTNGVYLKLPDGEETDVEPGIPQLIEPGAKLLLGEYLIVVDRS